MMRLFDAHCHLQDPRIASAAPHLIRSAMDSGVLRFAVNGVSEKDWHVVKQMSEDHPCVVPCFGLHPWFVGERSPDWFELMKEFFRNTPSAAVGEVGLDKGSHGKKIDFGTQVDVFRQQLELAKDLNRPVSVHCVRAFGELLEIMQSIGPFPAGVILHSYLGSAEMVPALAKFGSYFSFSGFLTFMNLQKAKQMLKAVPRERILLETDAPDALPKLNVHSLQWVPGDNCVPQELQDRQGNLDMCFPRHHASDDLGDTSNLPKETLNHPANIRSVLGYVASLLEIPEEELAEISYKNAMHLFSYPGSKVLTE
ncbi:hypothetical protein QJS10_CPA01g00463 [Acorus calamus]|uniref:TatD related DNase n=1 Tax=Acorus calamus TaxID=4465 RepID=A0AAV9FKX7_ACOCL|nr:hypothetical protein QJS10_CPA01g00463 [Acorus calamus]